MSDNLSAPRAEFSIFTADGGGLLVYVRLQDNNVWLTQALIAQMYGATPQNVSMHLK